MFCVSRSARTNDLHFFASKRCILQPYTGAFLRILILHSACAYFLCWLTQPACAFCSALIYCYKRVPYLDSCIICSALSHISSGPDAEPPVRPESHAHKLPLCSSAYQRTLLAFIDSIVLQGYPYRPRLLANCKAEQYFIHRCQWHRKTTSLQTMLASTKLALMHIITLSQLVCPIS